MTRIILSLLLLVSTCNAATWYCRPPVISGIDGAGKPIPVVGIYGAQDGTSYANAWNGLRSVVWGGAGVVAGDTLYVCGSHVHRTSDGNYIANQAEVTITVSGTQVSPIVIRGDYALDVGTVYGLMSDSRFSWNGPDVNGVYYQNNSGVGTHVYDVYFESPDPPDIGGANVTAYSAQTSETWVGGLGSSYKVVDGSNETNFIKTLTGAAPSTNVFVRSYGYKFNLGTQSNLVFTGLSFFDSRVTGTQNSDASVSCSSITFTNCVFTYGSNVDMYPGWDDWSFRNCTMSHGTWGVYTFLNSKSVGANRLTVSGCTISDMGLGRYVDPDSHAIGVQAGSGHIIEHNNIQRTGTAIEFWTNTQGMSNHTVRFNFIKDIAIKSNTTGSGIAVSGDNTGAVEGLRQGYKIYGNILVNMGVNGSQTYQGSAINSNNKDTMEIFGNSIYGCTNGIYCAVIGGEPLKATVKNNLIVGSKYKALWLSGTGSPTLDCDYNLFSDGISILISPAATANTHSVFADPLLLHSPPSTAVDFLLQPGSSATGAGVALPDWTSDYRGMAARNPPSIGAYEVGLLMRATTLNATTLK